MSQRSDLPSGTVTLLFTDVEGSTKLLHELGAEAYADALAEHRRLLRAAFTAHALREQIGVSEPWVARANQATVELLEQQLGAPALADAQAIGAAMSLEQAVELALEALKPADIRSASGSQRVLSG